jgi:hypothetical protein
VSFSLTKLALTELSAVAPDARVNFGDDCRQIRGFTEITWSFAGEQLKVGLNLVASAADGAAVLQPPQC